MSSFPFRNDSGETIPAFGIIRLTGLVVLEPGRVVLTAARPDRYGCQQQCAVNGPVPIAAGKFGTCLREGLMAAAYDTADGVPSIGETWGPRSGGWRLRKQTGGFVVVGATQQEAGLALVQPAPMWSFVGKTDAAHNKGATGTISIYAGPLGSEADTGADMPGVYNRFANVAGGKWVRCEWTGDDNHWELTAAEC